jgi:hypothetical protein
MSKHFRKGTIFLFVASGLFLNDSFATIIVSGDVSIVHFINQCNGSVDSGNQQFFDNIVQGLTDITVVKQPNAIICTTYVDRIFTYFHEKSTFTANIIDALTNPLLQNTDMLFIPVPEVVFQPEELTRLTDYINNGGSVFFLGDFGKDQYSNSDGFFANNAIINNTLSSMGSSLRIIDARLDAKKNTASNSQIAPDLFTENVQTLTYGLVSGVKGGTPLFYSLDGTPFIAYEPALTIPEPSAAMLLLIGCISLFCVVRKKNRS